MSRTETLQPEIRQPPSGTVTFLFTDIEGSTRLWERHPDEMGRALKLHDRLMREAIVAHGGHVFKTVGDAFCAAFPDAPSATAAALASQLALKRHDWPPPGRLHVRMALHTGRAEERDGDYYGRPLNRCARIEGLAHADQVLLSEDAAALVSGQLPAGATLDDLGSHRLRDLTRPERLFLLRHPELPDSYPPLRSLDARPNNLPVRRASFVGRQRELQAIKDRLQQTRLLTLKGVGGLGKTSLALQAAADLLDDFPDGVWFADLAPLEEPELVAQTTATALGYREEPGRSLVQTLTEELRDRELLLILDNCEHLIEPCAELADAILRRCPKVRLVATSRDVLGVAGEQVWPVPPLAVPDAPRRGATTDAHAVPDLLRSESVSLFVERALQVAPDFALTEANGLAVAEICRRLDGIALAIELAAARVPMMPPEKIARNLDQSLRLLTKGLRSARKHQATLRSAIDWSYELCTEDEQRLLRRLSVFHGGWAIEAAQTICADAVLDEWDILDLLTRLSDQSLVEVDAHDAEHPRHYLLETIRQYAVEKLAASDEDTAALRARHLAWFCGVAVESGDGLKGDEQARWLTRLESEHDNLRAALEWSADAGNTAEGLRMGGHLWRYWYMRGYRGEGRRRLDTLLACPDAAADPVAHATALHGAGTLAAMAADLATARRHLEQSLEIRRDASDLAGASATLHNLAMVANAAGDNAAAREILEENLEIKRQLRDDWSLANTLNSIATIERHEGHTRASRARLEESLQLWRRLGDRRMEAYTRMNLGHLDRVARDNASAKVHYRAALDILEPLGDISTVAEVKTELGRLLHDEGDLDAARTILQQALSMARAHEDRPGAAYALIESGRIDRYAGDLDAADRAFRESATLLADADHPLMRSTLDNAMGRLECNRGQLETARRHMERSLSVRREHRRRPWIVTALESFVILAVAEHRPEVAIMLSAAAEMERRAIGMPHESFEERELRESLRKASAALTDSEVDAARASGIAMGVDAAVEMAIEGEHP